MAARSRTSARTRKRPAAKRGGNANPLAEYWRKRDFSKTAEPKGNGGAKRASTLRFVIQKHAATRLHYDLRLELDGAMKSWAVPKGPSRDPADKRLAMQVEDHPIEYNTFEGRIPKGEYGAGFVIIWDNGTYEPEPNDIVAFRRDLANGRITFTLHGKRLAGTWSLVRMARGDGREWLLIKRNDEHVVRGDDLTEQDLPSIVSKRKLEGRLEATTVNGAQSDRPTSRSRPGNGASVATLARATGRSALPGRASAVRRGRETNVGLMPMLASVGGQVPTDSGWAFEPKYDGIRVLAYVAGEAVSLITRNDLDKAAQFPEIVSALQALAKRRKRAFVLDGEIVARTGKGLGRFQALQRRIGETDPKKISAHLKERPATLLAFDVLVDGEDVLVQESWSVRRKRLEKLLGGRLAQGLMLGDAKIGGGNRLLERGRKAGWEGIMAKRVDSTYQPGTRTRDWLKLKLEARQEFVVGGWTEPRKSRQFFGALLLGYWEGERLVYAGHTGGGFTHEGLADMMKRLEPLEMRRCPFDEEPYTNEPAHWVEPKLVVEVKFNEWTADGKLRQPIFLGLRDDKDPRSVVREPVSGTVGEK